MGKIIDIINLSRTVKAVAVEGGGYNDWAAYIGCTCELGGHQGIADNGDKLYRAHAFALFPDLAKKMEWRA